MRRRWGFLASLALVAGLIVPLGGARAGNTAHRFIVVYSPGVTLHQARAAVRAAGGTVVRENAAVGVATAVSKSESFIADVARAPELFGAALNEPIGRTTADTRPQWLDLERLTAEERASAGADKGPRPIDPPPGVEGFDPLGSLQWDMKMIHADQSYETQRGDDDVLVGIIDTGIDGSHPDIAPNFNAELSRNFTTDIPLVDGECVDDPDGSCEDPANVDENSHGTHVAGTVAAALNGLGVAGVAPGVTLVNLRAGQDSGFFFLQETVDALTYAGDNGVDVVNMSFFTDPWLYNCPDNPADSEEEQEQQQTIIEATQRAIDYARDHGVTPVAALGNEHTDLGNPTFDDISPDFPPGTEKERTVDNTCLDMPAEAEGVISVSSLGPSGSKSDFSNYGVEQTDVSAPGGWFRDFFGTTQHRVPGNLILNAYPESVAIAVGDLNPDGTPNTPFVVQDCDDDVCAYYQWIQGTSMAAPHAVGVVALIVSRFGVEDEVHGGLTLDPEVVQKILFKTASNHACPDPPLVSYVNVGRPESWDALCVGNREFNGFYGNGIVNAIAAVTPR
ncbi:MAG: S8 family peptidase [Actinomycetota bacterium]